MSLIISSVANPTLVCIKATKPSLNMKTSIGYCNEKELNLTVVKLRFSANQLFSCVSYVQAIEMPLIFC